MKSPTQRAFRKFWRALMFLIRFILIPVPILLACYFLLPRQQWDSIKVGLFAGLVLLTLVIPRIVRPLKRPRDGRAKGSGRSTHGDAITSREAHPPLPDKQPYL